MTGPGGGTAGAQPWDPRSEWPPHPRRLVAAREVVFDAMVVAHLAPVNGVAPAHLGLGRIVEAENFVGFAQSQAYVALDVRLIGESALV